MDSRRNISPAYDEHSRMTRRGPLPPTHHPIEPLPPELLEDKMATQAVEIEQLTMDNRKLAASYLNMRQDLAAAKGEAEKIREHIRSIQNEGDIQIRILLEKMAKRDADIGAGDTIKKELQQAHADARSLMTAKLELSVKLELATKELDYSREDIKKIPEMRSELDSLRQEYQRLRKTFEYEKSSNTEKVDQLKILEKDLIGIAEEVDRLHAEVLNAEKRANGLIPYSNPYINPDNGYPLPYHGGGGGGGYTDNFGRPHPHIIHGAAGEMMNHPYGSGGIGAAGNAGWGGVYNTSQAVGGEVTSAPVSSGAGNAVCEGVDDTSNAQM
ncbi:hypothetical protein C2S52_010578 [Perilla frutescens var. hirtella]|nr:hypothetical protein C2S52_010578 [Perilla frutescens var. hirtella]KAH6817417.1 hypothetical protein C2S51_001020 [Perilla frutescens var. frutescens]